MSETTKKLATVACPFCTTLNRVDLGRIDDRPKCGECGKPILLDRPIRVGENDLERIVQDADVPVLVDFYADWCGPCHQVAPLIEELSSKYGDTVRFVKVDIDESPDLAREYGVFSIPTILLFERGETKSRVTGARPAHVIERKLELTPSHRGGDHLHWSA
jgi:thioredoxin 2